MAEPSCSESLKSKRRCSRFIRMNRFGESSEVAEAVVWMCSSAASFHDRPKPGSGWRISRWPECAAGIIESKLIVKDEIL